MGDKRTDNVTAATPAIKAKAEADFQKAKAEKEIQKAVTRIVTAFTAYRTAARKGLPHAAEAGRELKTCKETCKANGIIWAQWCERQRQADDKFPVRYWCDKLITLAEGWDRVKDELGITSVEGAVLYIRNKGTDEGQPIKHKGTGKRAKKIKRELLTTTLTTRHLGISPDDFRELLAQLGVKIELVD